MTMIRNRRQFAWTLAAAAGAAGAFAAPGAFGQDDDRPPNVFISPPGQPFRAARGAPYPVADWFKQADKNGDGKLDHAEFTADAAAFFAILDLNSDGVLDPYEIEVYERRVAPEILGLTFEVGLLDAGRARLWLAQGYEPEGITNPTPDTRPKVLDESGQGAAPYSFFQSPEPVTAADVDFKGFVFKANFLKLADRHFARLDADNQGFLTLAKLPKTAVQLALEGHGPHHSLF
jgi:hypothetical protein